MFVAGKDGSATAPLPAAAAATDAPVPEGVVEASSVREESEIASV